ncbi:sulfotransferase [Microcoleus sp. LEGE 07076]
MIDVVEVLSVPLAESQGLLAFNLDAPETGTQTDVGAVEFRGWVLGKMSPAIAVEVIHQGRVLKTIPVNVPRPDVAQTYPQASEAGISGFQAILDLSRVIEQHDELTVYSILRDQSLAKMAEVTVKLGCESSTVEVPLPQQDAESGVDGIQLKLQRIQADLERSKVFVQTVKTDLLNREQLSVEPRNF